MTQIFRQVANPSEALLEALGGVDHYDETNQIPRTFDLTEEIVAKRAGYCVDVSDYVGDAVDYGCYAFETRELAAQFVAEVLVGGDTSLLDETLSADFGIDVTDISTETEPPDMETPGLAIFDSIEDANEFAASRLLEIEPQDQPAADAPDTGEGEPAATEAVTTIELEDQVDRAGNPIEVLGFEIPDVTPPTEGSAVATEEPE